MRRLAFFAICFVFSTTRILALDSASRISQYGHTVWRVQDGYFGSQPYAITQTKDGYIWVGTRDGLFRFDGVRFVRWVGQSGERLPSTFVVSLLAARDGSLWIGTDAGLAHMVKGHLFVYPKGDGQAVFSILEDREGRVWFSRESSADKTHPLCQALNADIRCYGKDDGVDGFGNGPLVQDSSGAIWVGTNTTLVEWRPGSSRVYRPQALLSNKGPGGIVALATAPDGTLWVGMGFHGAGAGLQHIVDGRLKPFATLKLNGETIAGHALAFDHQKNLWVGTNHGIYKIIGNDVDHYGTADGLSSDWILRILEDRESNLWVVTSQGIDMFRDLAVRTISKREGLSEDGVQSVVASRDGTVWIGTSYLDILRPDGVISQPGRTLRRHQVACLLEDHAGHLWVGMDNILSVYEGGRFRQIVKPDGSPVGLVAGMTEDSEDNIWVESIGPPGTLMRIRDLRVQQEFPTPQMPLSRKIVADPQSGIWLGLVNGNLARYRSGQLTTFDYGEHPKSRVNAIIAASDGSILGATAFGVVGWKDGRHQILTERNGLPCNVVNALIFDNEGNQWLFAQCGLIEIPKSEMSLWWEHPESRLKLRVFDALDGVQPGFGNFSNSTKAPDGRLWFANGNVLQVVDPAHLDANPLPPLVRVEQIAADGETYDAASDEKGGLRLPALVRDLTIDYTALSFVAPQKIHFRYKLEGQDSDWREVVNDRRVQYSNLAPKKYRFRVMACNNSGVWNEEGASLDFFIAPAYYQTNRFRALCVAAFLALLWALYQLRVHQLHLRFNAGLEARVSERTRIARELHDTLLQNLHGLMFQFQAARNMLPRRPDEAAKVLDIAIGATEQTVTDSRSAIQYLRSEQMCEGDLGQWLTATSQELARLPNANGDAPVFRLTMEGERKTLTPLPRDEVYRITREILRNAFQHAQARRIEAEIRYDDSELRVRIRDNGKGIDPRVLHEGGSAGHWGLRGVRERAQQIGARLDFWSEAGSGTEVELTVPAAIAYEDSGTRPRFSRLFRTFKS